jgi:hypothetical protein
LQVIKGDQNGYKVSGNEAGPPCSWGYKYGGLALQVGVGLQVDKPVTVKMLTVRKPKFGPQNSQNEWTGPKQWKMISEMKIVTWNVRTLYRALAMNKLVKEME